MIFFKQFFNSSSISDYSAWKRVIKTEEQRVMYIKILYLCASNELAKTATATVDTERWTDTGQCLDVTYTLVLDLHRNISEV